MKPLFIPLKAKYFDAFAAGDKTVEYRPYGPRWNERTCPVGREVVLSRGYGKAHRLTGKVRGFEQRFDIPATDVWRELYADRHPVAAAIAIDVRRAPKPTVTHSETP